MVRRKTYWYWLILVSIAIGIKIFSMFPAKVEAYYSNGFYPFISSAQRILFGWIPFSIGDFFYAAAGIWLIVGIVNFIRNLIKRKGTREFFLTRIQRIFSIFLWVYILFNALWGLNYNRLGIGHQLSIQPSEYSTEELKRILDLTVQKLHSVAEAANKERPLFSKKTYLFQKAADAYHATRPHFPFLKYTFPSVKPSLFSYLGNYMGYSGYYNPFTGEAQVNTTSLMTLQPFTTTHEIGHQLGYAREMDANFAGYLTSRNSADPGVIYSLYFDIYVYAVRNLYLRDSSAAKGYSIQLPEITRRDIREMQAFFRKYENPFEPLIRKLYGEYLRANEQPQGMLSYDEVLAWIVAYYRKYGTI